MRIMENIIIAMLYLYPGAIVDVIRKTFFRRTFREPDMNESMNTARYFVASTIISVVSLVVYAMLFRKSVANPQDIQKSLTGTMEIPKYFVVSFAVTVAYAIFLQAVGWMIAKVKSRWLKETESTKISPSVDAWHELVYGDDLKEIRGYLVLRISQGGQTVCGFSYFLPEFFEDGIALIRQEEVKAAFIRDQENEMMDQTRENREKPERLIHGPVAAYYDPKTGTAVEFFNGYSLSKTLK